MPTIAIPAHRIRPRAIHLVDSVIVRRPRAEVFGFLVGQTPERYPELARGHQHFKVLGGGRVRDGATIDCHERAGNQEVHHTYAVTAFREGHHIAYASTPSVTYIHLKNRVLEGKSDTFVYEDLAEIDARATRVTMTIVIAMPSLLNKWLALATGTRGLWARHLREELDGLARLASARMSAPTLNRAEASAS